MLKTVGGRSNPVGRGWYVVGRKTKRQPISNNRLFFCFYQPTTHHEQLTVFDFINPPPTTNHPRFTGKGSVVKPLTPLQKEKIIARLFWDTEGKPIDAESLIEAHLQSLEDIQSQQFFRKLLTSCDWYTLLKLIPAKKLKAILDDNIVNKIFPQDLKMKYKYARDILYR